MAAPTQATRNLAINTPLGEDKVLIVNATLNEQLGRLFQLEVDLISEDPGIVFDSIVGQNVSIRLNLLNSKTPRYFNGYVSRFVQTNTEQTGGRYRATLVPWLWFLTRSADCRIFQTMSVPDIIKKVFRDLGFTDFKDSLTGTYTAWDYCVQYRETDFNFVSRLMEQEGIYYFFEHENGKHTLVLADSASAHSAFAGYDSIPFAVARNTGGRAGRESILSWSLEQEVQPGTYSLNDFNFETPKTSLIAQSNIATQNAQSTFEIYDYPGEYGAQSEGTDYSKVRIEELHSQHEIVRGQSNARGVSVGYTFSLTNSPRADQNRTYLVTSASYQLTGDVVLAGDESGQGTAEPFACSFTAIDSTKPFRAARTTLKPLIQGPQTAIVVGPSGEEIHTDKYGRVKVQFHWDRYGKADENSSCWVRLSQAAWAGKKYGAIYIPRVGHEVIVEFLEGDPDLPIVTGRVYNADAMPPYDLPAEKTKTTLKSNSSKGGSGFNELRFEDKKDSEQIFVHAQKDMDIRVKNDRMEFIGNDRHLHITNNKHEKVDANRHEEVATSHFEKIGTDHNLTVGGKQAVKITGSQSVGVDGNTIRETGGNLSEKVTGKIYIVGSSDLVIEASTNITLKVGSSTIAIDATGIGLKAPQIKLEAKTIKIAGDAQAEMSSPLTKVAGTGTMTVEGAMVKVSASGIAEVSGPLVKIN